MLRPPLLANNYSIQPSSEVAIFMIEEHRKEGFMLTSGGMNLVSYGAYMGAWIEPVDK